MAKHTRLVVHTDHGNLRPTNLQHGGQNILTLQGSDELSVTLGKDYFVNLVKTERKQISEKLSSMNFIYDYDIGKDTDNDKGLHRLNTPSTLLFSESCDTSLYYLLIKLSCYYIVLLLLRYVMLLLRYIMLLLCHVIFYFVVLYCYFVI